MAGMSEAPPPATAATVDPVQAGPGSAGQPRLAGGIRPAGSLADREGKLSGSDLEALALSSFFTAQADLELAVKERAFAAYEAEGNVLPCGIPRARHRPGLRLRGQGLDRLRVEAPRREAHRARGGARTPTAIWALLGSEAARR